MVGRQSLLPFFASEKAGQHKWGTGSDLRQACQKRSPGQLLPFVLVSGPAPSRARERWVLGLILCLSFPGNWSGLFICPGQSFGGQMECHLLPRQRPGGPERGRK